MANLYKKLYKMEVSIKFSDLLIKVISAFQFMQTEKPIYSSEIYNSAKVSLVYKSTDIYIYTMCLLYRHQYSRFIVLGVPAILLYSYTNSER